MCQNIDWCQFSRIAGIFVFKNKSLFPDKPWILHEPCQDSIIHFEIVFTEFHSFSHPIFKGESIRISDSQMGVIANHANQGPFEDVFHNVNGSQT
jgi:hypothetical protein